MKDWRISEEANKAKQFKAIQFHISQLQSKLNFDDGGSKRTETNSNNNSLQGIKCTVFMEDKDDELESSAKAQPTVKIYDVHFYDLAVHLGDVNLEVKTVGFPQEHISEPDTHANTCVIGKHTFII